MSVLAPTMAAVMPGIGNVLADRYELRAHLGSGGMGAVYRAFDRELDEDVALKLLRGDVAATDDALVRFRREVKLARRITHPCVARTFDLGVHPGMRFLTMELIEGQSLRARTETPIALPEALRVVSQACRGLAAAHAQGVTHRDLKPENVMLSGTRVVVTDFGIARADGDDGVTHGAIVGTPAYMAPEQVEGRVVDGRADVYALGVLLYELVAGELPFHGDTALAIAFARLTNVAPDPRRVRADLPEGVAALVRAMLERARENRPDAQRVADRLDELLGLGGEHARPARTSGPSLVSLETPSGLGTMSTVSVAVTTPQPEHGALGADVSRAISDSLATEPRLSVVRSNADVSWDGEVRVSGERVRVRMRLVSRSGAVLYAGQVDGALSDPFGLEDVIATRTRDETRRRVGARRGPADDALRARFDEALATSTTTPGATSFDFTVNKLEELHRLAPTDPVLGASLALAIMRRVMARGELDAAGCVRAEELALRARDTDPTLGESYHAIAMVRAASADWHAAYSAVREAVARNPMLADAHVDISRIICQAGYAREGLSRVQLALRLGPIALYPARLHEVRVLALTGELERASAIVAELRHNVAPTVLAEVLARKSLWTGERATATEAATLLTARGGLWQLLVPALALYGRGEPYVTELVDALARLERPARTRGAAQMSQVTIELFALAGEDEHALTELEGLLSSAWGLDVLWLDGAPPLATLRESPRFATVRARMAQLGEEIVG